MQAINPTRASSTVRRTHSDDIVRTYGMTNCKMREIKNSRDNKLPYIAGEADGLAFSSYGKMTPSLEVVFAEINRTYTCPRTVTHLDDWAAQGVLLLNAVLTTQMGKSKAHEGWGWELFTQEVLSVIGRLPQPIVVMTWGRDAQSILSTKFITKRTEPTLYLKACHPQAQNWNPANKFVGCNHFIDCNLFLMKHGISPVWWSDPPENGVYIEYYKMIDHLKTTFHAETDLPALMYSHPAIPDKPHPFSHRLEPPYKDTLPF